MTAFAGEECASVVLEYIIFYTSYSASGTCLVSRAIFFVWPARLGPVHICARSIQAPVLLMLCLLHALFRARSYARDCPGDRGN